MIHRDGHLLHIQIHGDSYREFVGEIECPHDAPGPDVAFEDRPACWQPYKLDETDEDDNPIPDLNPTLLENGLCLVQDWYENECGEIWDLSDIHKYSRTGYAIRPGAYPVRLQWWFDDEPRLCIAPEQATKPQERS